MHGLPTAFASTDVETNSYQALAKSSTITFNVSRAVNVDIDTLVHESINSSRCLAFDVVEGEKPAHTARCAASDANVAHVNHAQIRVLGCLSERAFLKMRTKK